MGIKNIKTVHYHCTECNSGKIPLEKTYAERSVRLKVLPCDNCGEQYPLWRAIRLKKVSTSEPIITDQEELNFPRPQTKLFP